MTHQQTTLRHLWLAGLGAMARLRRTMDQIAGRTPVDPEVVDESPEFVTIHKPAKRVTRAAVSSGSRRAGERESQRRIAGKGRK
jgi:hypothetical protein